MTPINFKPNPTSPCRQPDLTVYQLATVCTYSILSDLFGVSLSDASAIFNEIYWLMAASLYDRNIHLPTTDEEWQNEICSFLRNYEFSCIGAWDGFNAHLNSFIF